MTPKAWNAIVLLLLLAGCASMDSGHTVRIVWEGPWGDDVIIPTREWAPALTVNERWRYDGEFRMMVFWDVTEGYFEI